MAKSKADIMGLIKDAGKLWAGFTRGASADVREGLEAALKEEAATRELRDLRRDAGQAAREVFKDVGQGPWWLDTQASLSSWMTVVRQLLYALCCFSTLARPWSLPSELVDGECVDLGEQTPMP